MWAGVISKAHTKLTKNGTKAKKKTMEDATLFFSSAWVRAAENTIQWD